MIGPSHYLSCSSWYIPSVSIISRQWRICDVGQMTSHIRMGNSRIPTLAAPAVEIPSYGFLCLGIGVYIEGRNITTVLCCLQLVWNSSKCPQEKELLEAKRCGRQTMCPVNSCQSPLVLFNVNLIVRLDAIRMWPITLRHLESILKARVSASCRYPLDIRHIDNSSRLPESTALTDHLSVYICRSKARTWYFQ